MSNKNLFKEAIADAKAVREAALANAKAALEEALTPKLQSMLAAKLQEYDMDDAGAVLSSEEDEFAEGFTSSHDENSDANLDFNLEEEEDFDLSEILAELNEAEEADEEEESEEEEEESEEEEEESEEEEEESEEEEEESEEEDEEEMDIKDMSVEDLKDLIKDIVSQEMSAEEDTAMELGAEEEDSVDMDMGDVTGETASDEIDLEELLAELDALGDVEDEVENDIMETKKKSKEKDETKAQEKSEMKEALATISILRNELNEVNLLNAKLLYVNKLFKAKNLTESQKVKVIASFDKATNVKEAKAVFEALQENLNTPAKKQIKESLGFASKAAGMAPKRVIVESDDVIARMQKLANIK